MGELVVGLHPICVPAGWPVSVSYRPLSVGIFGMVSVLLYCKIWRELLNINLAGTYFFFKRGARSIKKGAEASR